MFQRGFELKTPAQLDVMRQAGLVVGGTLELLREAIAPGVTPLDLDAMARESIFSQGATSNFLGYHGFPAVICTSVNDQVVHGIPRDVPLREGDVISIDCGAIVDGWHGDAAITAPVGEIAPDVAELLRVTEESMWRGFAAAALGGRVGDISNAIERYVDSQGSYGIVDGYTGHGIGSEMHMPPSVPNAGRAGRGPKLVEGMALAVEPMISLGTDQTRTLDDDWTVVSTDGSWAAHFEHTFTLTPNGAWILTALDGGAAKLAELGVHFGGR